MRDKNITKPELVSPAGDWASLYAAAENGADSVYFGLKQFNMRGPAVNFDVLELPKIIKFLHDKNKKGYLTLNTIIMEDETGKVEKILNAAKKAEVDAVILWDTAVLSMAKKLDLRIHLSTQASVANKDAVLFYSGLGVKRIVLARECSLKDIKIITDHIAKKNISCEIETFVHGAMCVSISGRCFLSEYSFGKSANRGRCLQPCRREYDIYDVEKETSYRIGRNYVLSPKDLCGLEFIEDLISAGVKAFKIEGRMKSAEYVKTVTSVYRRAIDAFSEKGLTASLKTDLMKELRNVYNRGFSKGFLFGVPQDEISKGLEHTREKIFIGEVRNFFKQINVARIRIFDHSLKTGDTILFIGKKTPAKEIIVAEMQCEHKPRKRAVSGEEIGVKFPFIVKRNDKVFLWRERRRYGG
jgi:U32 family peptidase